MAQPPSSTRIFLGTASLVDELDKKLVVELRDGRRIIGILRSFDQFANVVLQNSVERVYVEDHYADIPRGLFVIRGENVVLMGEMDPEREAVHDTKLHRVTIDEILVLQQEQLKEQEAQERLKQNIVADKSLMDFGVDDV